MYTLFHKKTFWLVLSVLVGCSFLLVIVLCHKDEEERAPIVYAFTANSQGTFVYQHNWLSSSVLKPEPGALCMHIFPGSFSGRDCKYLLFEADDAKYTIDENDRVYRNGQTYDEFIRKTGNRSNTLYEYTGSSEGWLVQTAPSYTDNWLRYVRLSSYKTDICEMTEQEILATTLEKYQSIVFDTRTIPYLKKKLVSSPEIEFLELDNRDKFFKAADLKSLLESYKGRGVTIRNAYRLCPELNSFSDDSVTEQQEVEHTLKQFQNLSYEYVSCDSGQFASALCGETTKFVDSNGGVFFPKENTVYKNLRFADNVRAEKISDIPRIIPELEVLCSVSRECSNEEFALLAGLKVKLLVRALEIKDCPENVGLTDLQTISISTNRNALEKLLLSSNIKRFSAKAISGVDSVDLSEVFDGFLSKIGKQELSLFLCNGCEGLTISRGDDEDFVNCWGVNASISKTFRGRGIFLKLPNEYTKSFPRFREQAEKLIKEYEWKFNSGIRRRYSKLAFANVFSDVISIEFPWSYSSETDIADIMDGKKREPRKEQSVDHG